MGRICPILNHPLNDGVLVEDEALVNFIRKRNLDFLPNELVCRSCKREITKLYNKKLRRAIELQKSRLHDGSVSSLKTSKSSSSSSTNSERLLSLNESFRRAPRTGLQNNATNYVPQNINTVIASQIVNLPEAIVPENQNNHVTIPVVYGNKSNVTVRKKTIKDYLTIEAPKQKPATSFTPHVPMSVNSPAKANGRANQNNSNQTASNEDDQDDMRRLSQEPTTSNAASANTRRVRFTIESEDEDLSLNAVNGTRLPNVQPIPPKRKAQLDNRNTLAQDIMDEYIKDIHGG